MPPACCSVPPSCGAGADRRLPGAGCGKDALAAEQAAAEGQAAVNDDQISLFLALGGGGARRNRRQTVIAAATCRPERTRSITPESALAEWTI
jgi:hypothetical protein